MLSITKQLATCPLRLASGAPLLICSPNALPTRTLLSKSKGTGATKSWQETVSSQWLSARTFSSANFETNSCNLACEASSKLVMPPKGTWDPNGSLAADSSNKSVKTPKPFNPLSHKAPNIPWPPTWRMSCIVRQTKIPLKPIVLGLLSSQLTALALNHFSGGKSDAMVRRRMSGVGPWDAAEAEEQLAWP